MTKRSLNLEGTDEWGIALAAVVPAFRLTLATVAHEKGDNADMWLDTMKAALIRDYKMTMMTEGMSYESEAKAGKRAIEIIDFVVEASRKDMRERRSEGEA